MSTNSKQTATAVWQAAIAANEAKLIAQGFNGKKAHKLALAKARSLHPSHQATVRRNIAANRDYIICDDVSSALARTRYTVGEELQGGAK